LSVDSVQVFDGVVGVLDGQLWIASAAEDIGPDMYASFAGQRNGLLGAAEAGALRFITGKADGDIGLSVRVAGNEPQLDESWEECVEASFSPATPVVALFDWDGNVLTEIPLGEQTYRVRYTARGMDEVDSGTVMDEYGLWFWPAPAAPDAVIKQTSKSAAYWHAEMARENAIRSELSEE
jgi:hypothetical protein